MRGSNLFIPASAFDTIIDIGAGMGHLARILSASIPECNVIAVEQNEELIERSILLNDRLQQIKNGFRLPEHYCESVQSGFSGSVLRSLNEGEIERDEESRCIIKSVDIEWQRFLVVHCLRLLFAPIVEQIIIKDRVQYLEECGHSVAVVPLFDPRISPRNFAIIAMKDG
ncbi:hypothetical protein ANCCAN_24715 [Ancylostoma caninum]|uniref:Methyltransferase domain-containing protein n=1 Tax=Ancylostoma caninum TaxID=29170 RepID=A0A368FBM6_ANCCA|nr:hypothetical protein ANCCAN_24715 [Ancylostoma caninum]